MAAHCFKLYNLTPSEMRQTEKRLAYFIRHGVKVTALRRVIYIHLDDSQTYSGVFNMLHYFIASGRLHCNEKSQKWLQRYIWTPNNK
jgi:hypothetical protein